MSAFSVLASLPEDHFRCSICMDVFTDPVSTPCGHNFCRICLNQHWDNSELCHCPICNKRFHMRPEFSTNAVISEISVQIKRRKIEALESNDAPGQVKCDVCTEFKFKALKSCLVCLTSYCEAHLEPHQRVPSLMRHKLMDPVENLEEKVCQKHARILEFFCRYEQVCICLLCCETEHKDHETVPVEEEGAQRKENIESKQLEIKRMIDERKEKIKEFSDCFEMRKVKTDKEIEDSEKLFNTLMDKVKEIHSKLRSNIEEKLRKSQERDQAMIRELHEEIVDLQRKCSQLEELSQNEDHLKLLQNLQALNIVSDTKDWSKIKVYSDLCMQTVRGAVSHLVHTFQAELRTLTNTELTKMRRYKKSVTFNPSTAGPHLVVTESGKHLKHSKTASLPSLCDRSQRFKLPMIFGTNVFTSGRHYWEVQVGLRNDWDVGVAKETVDKTDKVIVKKEKGFFSIGKMGFDYEVNCTPRRVLHLCPRPREVGVYLDYEEGRVSFYDVNQKLHIHSFIGECFTEKLFPYFYLYSGAKKSEPLVITSMTDRESLLSLLHSLEKKTK
ncbi:E3 ubiquitin-protein ligase TRIM39-like [Leuresthes tenuis]|uniref:E3 ubiquitin-protein ligase TRIM39-like n=1 Tax=Leuresthes tenuis TaxID=355514 RepID=UPI003B50E323